MNPMAVGNSSFTSNNLKFEEIIKLYETQYEELPDKKLQRTKNDINTIDMDIKRTFPFDKMLTEEERKMFRKDLKKVLMNLPVIYIQSMSDIIGIIMYFYYTQDRNREVPVNVEERENTTSAVGFNLNIKAQDSLFEPEMYDVMLRTIFNILKQKYEPLIRDEFKLYMEFNDIFIKVMEKRHVKVPSSKSLVYTNSTLTWFSRSLTSMEDIYKIFAIIISSPINGVFLFLIHYFDEIEGKKQIHLEKKEIMSEMFKLEQEFLAVQTETNKTPLTKKKIALALTAGAVITGAILFNAFRKR